MSATCACAYKRNVYDAQVQVSVVDTRDKQPRGQAHSETFLGNYLTHLTTEPQSFCEFSLHIYRFSIIAKTVQAEL